MKSEDSKRKFVLCHFPFEQWERGWINLHGHTHGTYKPKFAQWDVGVDMNPYRPIHVEEAIELAFNGGKMPTIPASNEIDLYNRQQEV